MKQKLLSLFMLLGLLGTAGSAWGKIVWPTKTISYRTNAALASATAWSNGYPADKSTTDKVEINGAATGPIWLAIEYVIPNYTNVSSITLPLTYNGSINTASISVYSFPYAIPDAGASYDDAAATYVNNVSTVTGGTALATLSDGSMSLTISGDALTTLKSAFSSFVSDGNMTVRFLFTTSSRADIYGATAAVLERRPHLEVSYSTIANTIYNQTQSTAYADVAALNTALTASGSAADGDVIVFYDDVLITSRLTISKGVTFKAAENAGDINIYRWHDYGTNLILMGSNKTVVFDGTASGASLTIDNLSASKAYSVFQTEGNSDAVTFNSVTFKNVSSSSPYIFAQKNIGTASTISGGTITLNNVTFESTCTPANGLMSVWGNNKAALASLITNNSTSPLLYFNGDYTISDSYTTAHTPYDMRFGSFTSGTTFLASGNAANYYDSTFGYIVSKSGTGVIATTAPTTSYTLAVSSAGMATLVLPFNASLPSGVTAYKLTTTSSVVSANSVESIAANEPVLIVANEGNYEFTGSSPSYSASPVQSGALIGTYVTMNAEDGNYVLQKIDNEVGFYKLAASSNHVINPFRAYLSGAENAAARLSIVFEDSETTGISSLTPSLSTKGEGSYYNLNGQHVSQPTKGLYIQNGKKIIMK